MVLKWFKIIINTALKSKQYPIFGYLSSHSTNSVSHLDSNDLVLGRKTARNVFIHVTSLSSLRARAGWFCVFLDPTTLPPARSHCQTHVARVYFQQPIATQIALYAMH